MINISPDDTGQLFEHAEVIPKLIEKNRLLHQEIPNPHWRDGACHTCHQGDAKIRPAKLREDTIEGVCRYCHELQGEHSYIHPVGVKADVAMLERMPAAYRDALKATKGIISCSTCHDLYKQCLPKFRLQRGLNPAFFRKGPFRSRTKACYFCHDPDQYVRLNPHEQISDEGVLNESSCRICHSENVEVLRATSGTENLDFQNEKDLSSLCTRCHQVKPHPVVTFIMQRDKEPPNHLVEPSDKKLKRMQKQTEADDFIMPLEPGTGKIFCATCHNPHEKGVIMNVRTGKGADVKKRLRQAGKKICIYCHDI